MFCPECGKALAPAEPVAPLANASPDAEQPAAAEMSSAMTTSTIPQTVEDKKNQSAGSLVEPAVEVEANNAKPMMKERGADQPVEPGSKPGTRERTRERLHRASSVARGALEDNVKRVEKIHHVSTAMIEEATYDPSLRFVLVALGLFVVFVILLVLSKVMG
jgi:hypothetical protein